ncbi:unnamed protein product [Parascedosporium putredinis]|uniref:aldehyde dehydrogenase (NAD(+)) n=1 Tax=Parascedosporium putredinis TaxID=1442378 RepID=A0A9P1M5L7_9PEZI|nr:unnamed protein product [Parascedosporium putredinis]CAI7988194.1 unnamed protein product [Parascedosporium putredinis]
MSECLTSFLREQLAELPEDFVVKVLSAVVACSIAGLFVKILLFGEPGPKRYTVPPPKLPDQERIVDEANIRIPGSTALQCYAPATGQFLGLINPSTADGIDRAIEAAAAAQKKWATTTFRERRAVMRSMLQYVLDNQEELCRIACLDSGKTMVDAQLGEILALRPSRRPTNLLMTYKRNEVVYEPLGVVAALVSWNYPFHNLIGPVISALFAGNAIVVKVSEQTAWSASFFASVARGALVAHGHDPALVQPIVCWPHVAASAAEALIPVVAELGGKDPSIILASAAKDLDRIHKILLRGTFQSAGQNCIGIERIIVADSLYDKVVALVEPKVKAIRLGPTADMGAMISDGSFSRLENLVASAVKDGARLLAGGKRYAHPEHPKGHYFQPTLLVDVTPDMEIANEECFGPIMVIMRAPAPARSASPADIADSILAIANAPDFGLGASVFGKESDPVLPLVVRGLRTGGVAVNDFAAFYAVQLPFGGVAGSGYGRFAGEEGLRGLCNAKSICHDRAQCWRFTKGVVDMGYALGVGGMVAGVFTILQNM